MEKVLSPGLSLSVYIYIYTYIRVSVCESCALLLRIPNCGSTVALAHIVLLCMCLLQIYTFLVHSIIQLLNKFLLCLKQYVCMCVCLCLYLYVLSTLFYSFLLINSCFVLKQYVCMCLYNDSQVRRSKLLTLKRKNLLSREALCVYIFIYILLYLFFSKRDFMKTINWK